MEDTGLALINTKDMPFEINQASNTLYLDLHRKYMTLCVCACVFVPVPVRACGHVSVSVPRCVCVCARVCVFGFTINFYHPNM